MAACGARAAAASCRRSACSHRLSATPNRNGHVAAFRARAARTRLDRGPQRRRSSIAGPTAMRSACAEIAAGTGSRSRRTSSSLARRVSRGRCCSKRRAPCPIVFAAVADPVGAGFVASLARPGGNVTGFCHFEYELARQMAGTAAARSLPGVIANGGPRQSAMPAHHGQFGAASRLRRRRSGWKCSPINAGTPTRSSAPSRRFAQASGGR